MHINFGPRGILEIDDARIVYRNFRGEGSKYNREGDRNFSVLIENIEQYEALKAEGWNPKLKPSRDDEDVPFITLPVKVKFNDRGPNVYLISGNKRVELDEDTVSCLDHIEILSVDLDLRPYDWEVNGATGRSAYLDAIKVYQKVDRFAEE